MIPECSETHASPCQGLPILNISTKYVMRLVLIALVSTLFGLMCPTNTTSITTMTTNRTKEPEVTDPPMSDSLKLVKYFHETLNDGLICERKYFNEELKAERDATNAKILKVNTCLANKVEAVHETIRHHSDIEADINLKLETSGSYYLELINSLRSMFQESLISVKSEIQALKDKAAPTCQFCAQTFQSTDHLVVHVVNYHSIMHGYGQQNSGSQPSTLEHSCNFCHYAFLSQEDLDKHADDHHSVAHSIQQLPVRHAIHMSEAPFPQSCSICSMLFTTKEGLENHMWSHREVSVNMSSDLLNTETGDESQNMCDPCDSSFDGNCYLKTHPASEHSSPSLRSPQTFIEQDLSPIPQCDGADDGYDDSVLQTVVTQPSSVSTLNVSYELNRQRQVGRLARDAVLPDFDISTNDNDRNVNIQCSVGFYEAVVKPAFSTLSSGSSFQVSGVLIKCTVFRTTQDRSSNSPGLFLRFELSGTDMNPNPAPLSIHLHHTQRKVQLQGGSSMPDRTSAPVWFVEHFLKPMFISQAESQNIQIENINQLVKNIATRELGSRPSPGPSETYCYHCNKKFSGQSRPVPCSKCTNLRHSTRCSPCPAASTVPDTDMLVPVSTVRQSIVPPSTTCIGSSRAILHLQPEICTPPVNRSRPVSSTVSFPLPPPCTSADQPTSIGCNGASIPGLAIR